MSVERFECGSHSRRGLLPVWQALAHMSRALGQPRAKIRVTEDPRKSSGEC
jgi:hypothetical protein